MGGSQEQRELLRSIVDGMAGSSIQEIAIRPAPAEWRPFPPGAVVLAFRGPSAADSGVRAFWERLLIAGVFRDLSSETGKPAVVAYESGDGSSRIGPLDPEFRKTVPSPPAASERAREELEARVEKQVAEAGAQIEQLDLLAPHGLAAAVTMRVDDPARFLKSGLRNLLFAFDDRYRALEGMYFRVVDQDGAFAWEAANTTRASSVSGRTRPDLEGCSPVIRSRPCCKPPPPCPAG